MAERSEQGVPRPAAEWIFLVRPGRADLRKCTNDPRHEFWRALQVGAVHTGFTDTTSLEQPDACAHAGWSTKGEMHHVEDYETYHCRFRFAGGAGRFIGDRLGPATSGHAGKSLCEQSRRRYRGPIIVQFDMCGLPRPE